MSKKDKPTKAIAYYRVSTKKQGQSGLGLESQQASVQAYAKAKGLTIISPPGEYTEVETGTNKKHRPKLQAALKAAKDNDAVLLIAKLDRLARNVHFITGLKESGVKFVAVDMPEANDMQVQFMAMVAEYEAKLTSERTKAALKAAKERGIELGSPDNLTHEAQIKGAASNRQKAEDAYNGLIGYMTMMREKGGKDGKKMTYRAIADRLNKEKKRTRQGKEFQATTVMRILKRAA